MNKVECMPGLKDPEKTLADFLAMAPAEFGDHDSSPDLSVNKTGRFVHEGPRIAWAAYQRAVLKAEEPVDDQAASDNAFYTKQLQAKAAEILGLDPENTSWFEIVGLLEKTFTDYTANLKDATQRLKDYEEAHWDVLKLTNELDEAINGFNRAERPRLCDIVAQVRSPLFLCLKMPPGLDHLNRNLVHETATNMAAKMRAAEIKYGYGASWLEKNWEAKCRSDLMFHIDKGDPTDVVIYAAFMMHHGWSTSPKPAGR